MSQLEADLERIKELAYGEKKIHDYLSVKKDDIEYISDLKVGDILPEGYEELFSLNNIDPDIELTVHLVAGRNSQYGVLQSIRKILNEDIGTFLPWLYMDGPYTFEFGGREKREIMRGFVKDLLVIYGVSEELVEKIASQGW